MSDSLKGQLQDAMKAAMRAKEKTRLGVIRLILSAIKQREVDERIELDDKQVLLVLDKMLKQRRESIAQFLVASRDDLVAVEEAEIVIIQEFMPEPLSEAEVASLISHAISEAGAESMKDMGKVMAIIKPKAQGRVDMSMVSKLIKAQLS